MAIRQFMIYLIVTRECINEVTGKPYDASRMYQVDLVSDDVQEFLAKIPDDISEKSMIWACITRPDGKHLPFVDGIEQNGVRVQGSREEEHRAQAAIMAERRLRRLEQEKAES